MTINTILVKIARLFLAATFIISAAAKIYSMHFFDGLVAGQLIGDDFFNHPTSYFWVQILTRVIIAGEFMLGVAVLQKKYLHKLVLPVMGGLLILFSLQIVYEASFNGKGYVDGNCGCFGEVIPFDNFQTIIKNVVLFLIVFFVYKKHKDISEMTFGPVVPSIVVGIFTFFTMYLTIEDIEEPNITVNETSGSIKAGIEENTVKDTKLDFSSDFKVGSQGSEFVLKNNSIVKTGVLNAFMWFSLPGAAHDSVPVIPGEEVKIVYDANGVFDVSLIFKNGEVTDTLTKKAFFNVQAKENTATVNNEEKLRKAQELQLIQKKKEEELKKKREEEALVSSNSIFAPYRTGWSDGKYKDLDKGTHIICMFSLTCSHCQEAYRDILAAREKKAIAKPYILAYGGEYDLEPFWRKTGAKSPYILIKKYAQFSSLLKGGGFPRIVVVENGKMVKTWDAESYSKESFYKYFGLSKAKEVPDSEDLILEDNSTPPLNLGSGQGATIDLE